MEKPTVTYAELASMSKKELNAQPCDCITCGTCHGTGRMRDQYSEPWVDEYQSCYDCDGGVTDTCDRCRLLIEIEHDEEFSR